jgi:hypothetical protein
MGGTNEHAIVEISFDKQSGDIMKKYQELIKVKFSSETSGNKSGQKLFCTEALPKDVRIMDQGGVSYTQWRDSGFTFQSSNTGVKESKKVDTRMQYVPKKDKRDLVAWAPEGASITQSIKKSF